MWSWPSYIPAALIDCIFKLWAKTHTVILPLCPPHALSRSERSGQHTITWATSFQHLSLEWTWTIMMRWITGLIKEEIFIAYIETLERAEFFFQKASGQAIRQAVLWEFSFLVAWTQYINKPPRKLLEPSSRQSIWGIGLSPEDLCSLLVIFQEKPHTLLRLCYYSPSVGSFEASSLPPLL